ETASVLTGSKVELWFPLASSEPGVQEIERLDVTITPDVPYDVSSDSRGNRVLHLSAAAPVAVKVTYRVLRTESRPDFSRLEKRPLTEAERALLAAELAPTTDPSLSKAREAGRPARGVAGFVLGTPMTADDARMFRHSFSTVWDVAAARPGS